MSSDHWVVKASIEADDNCKPNISYDKAIGSQVTRATFNYPCVSSVTCKPYQVLLDKGKYSFELWGAQGGNARYCNQPTIRPNSGGKGAYVSGVIAISQKTLLYLYIGGKGEDQISIERAVLSKGGFNGGGDGGIDLSDASGPETNSGGGGGTDIRLIQGSSIESLKSRIIVAGGGGSACSENYNNLCNSINPCHNSFGGGAGSLTGFTTNSFCFPGNQTSGSFGIGTKGLSMNYNPSTEIYGGSTGGGGGGYYGGTTISLDQVDKTQSYGDGGAGGSSFVSGCNGCNAVSYEPFNEVTHSNHNKHYSGLVFHDINMKTGKDEFLSPTNIKETGHSGNGCISISFLSNYHNSCNNNVKSFYGLLLLINIFLQTTI